MGRRTGVATVAAVVVVALSSIVIGWWALVAGAVLLLAGAVALLVARPTDPSPAHVRMEDVESHGAESQGGEGDAGEVAPLFKREEPESRRRKHIFREEVPSARADYRFLFSAVVCWHELDDAGPAAEGIALAHVADRVRAATAKESPEDREAAQYRLTALLGGAERCFEGGVSEVWAEEVRLELSDEDTERLKRLREFRKQQADREDEREAERRERTYLGDDVLSDPGRAVVWWVARHKGDIDEAVAKIGELAVLSSAATGREIPDIYEDLMVRLQSAVAVKNVHVHPPNGMGDSTGTQEGLWNENGHVFTMGPGGVPEDDEDGGDDTTDDEVRDEDAESAAAPWWVQAVETETSGCDDDERYAFAHALARWAVANGVSGAREDLRVRFGVSDVLADEPEEDGSEDGEPRGDGRERSRPFGDADRESDPGRDSGEDVTPVEDDRPVEGLHQWDGARSGFHVGSPERHEVDDDDDEHDGGTAHGGEDDSRH